MLLSVKLYILGEFDNGLSIIENSKGESVNQDVSI